MMDNENLKNSIFSGVFWKFAERILAQGVSFIVSVILARISYAIRLWHCCVNISIHQYS